MPTPTILFKFINSAEHAKTIASGSLKFTAIPELNDPIEMLPIWNESAYRASLAHVRQHGCSERELAVWLEQEALINKFEPKRAQAPRSSDEARAMAGWPGFDDQALMRERLNRLVELLRGRLGVLSLTTRFDSLPMWAHYAANASGFLVAYKNLDDALPRPETPLLFRSLQVNYDDADGVTFHPESYQSIFLRKLPDWRYEAEWRVIADLQRCDALDCSNDGRPLRGLVQVNPAHVVGFFAGWRMAQDTYERFNSSVLTANRSASVVRLDRDREGRPDFSQISAFLAANT